MPDCRTALGISVPGLLTTLLTVAFVTVGCWQAYLALSDGTAPSLHEILANEGQAVEHLKSIQVAQKAFKMRHPHGEHARFVAHLWQWVDPRGNPLRLNLVSRRLAMAMDPTKAVDGYHFVAVRKRTAADGTEARIDYQRQWAVAALPASFGKSGRLVFLADQTGNIFVQAPPRPPSSYPMCPTANQWIQIDSHADLNALQARLKNKTAP